MIEELRQRIAETEAKLALYRKVLEVELRSAPDLSEQLPSPPLAPVVIPDFAGDKTAFVLDVLKAHGSAGATIQDINKAFLGQRVDKGKNLVYVALNALIGRNQAKRNGNRYFFDHTALTAKRNQRNRKHDLMAFLDIHGPMKRAEICAKTRINTGTVGFHLKDGGVFERLPDGRYDLRRGSRAKLTGGIDGNVA